MQNIKKPNGESILRFENGRTVDIQAVMMEVNKADIWRDTADFSKQYAANKASLKKLWQFVKYNIRYKEDPEGVQLVRTPSRLFYDGVGDCKSFTLFIVSVLQNLGIPYTIRFAKYGRGPVTHVYPVAHLADGDVILDAVWTTFDSEKKYYGKAENFKFQKPMSAIYKLSGIGETATSKLAMMATLPQTSGPDITEMTDAEFYRFLGFKTIGATAQAFNDRMAFTPPTLLLPYDPQVGALFKKGALKNVVTKAGQAVKNLGVEAKKVVTKPGAAAKNVVKKTGEVVKNIGVEAAKVAAKVKEAWKALINWVFKNGLTKAAPFFLFSYLKKDVSPRIAAIRAKQNGILTWLCKTAGIDRQKVDATMRAAIVKQFGKQPEQILNTAAKATVAGIGVIPPGLIMEGLKILLDIIQKIAGFFKSKKEASETPTADASSASDLDVLTADTTVTGETKPAGNDNPTGQTEVRTPSVQPAPQSADTEVAPTQSPAPVRTPPSSLPPSVPPRTNTPNTETDGEDAGSAPTRQPVPSGKLKRQKQQPTAAASTGMSTGAMVAIGVGVVVVASVVLKS